ncbi:hypothetical protein E2C01_027624 [Portunus trituberculatus]|uniref:Uncharacterized protein n=1 Tax=Portunus trituberculatus TaxID=210409 RepID=A0A5B7EIC5_PORTR|nr:hypothetical protein [Portunus trituberculatus]
MAVVQEAPEPEEQSYVPSYLQSHDTNSEMGKNKMGGEQQEDAVFQPAGPKVLVEFGVQQKDEDIRIPDRQPTPLPCLVPTSMETVVISHHAVRRHLKGINIRKTPDPDGISPYLKNVWMSSPHPLSTSSASA